jgi:hypothetical protein
MMSKLLATRIIIIICLAILLVLSISPIVLTNEFALKKNEINESDFKNSVITDKFVTRGDEIKDSRAKDLFKEEWNKTYGGSGWEDGISVQQTSDGGYIICGITSSYGAGEDDAWLIKTNASGNEQWNKTYGGSEVDYGLSVQQTSDDGYIMVGYTASYGVGGAGNGDIWLVKTNSSGIEQWNKTFGGISWDFGHAVQQTSDNGYIIVGQTESYGAGDVDIWLIKTNPSGIEQWNKTFGGSKLELGPSVQQTSDKGYIITGCTNSTNSGDSDLWLIKTNASGDEQWNKTFGGIYRDEGQTVQQTSDGGYIIAGATNTSNNMDLWLIKTNASGNEQWNKTFGGSKWDISSFHYFGHAVQQTSDNGYIIVGTTESYGAGDWDVWIIKTNASGNEQWNKTFGGRDEDYGHSIQHTSDGGYIISGLRNSSGVDGQEVWLIKINRTDPNQPPIANAGANQNVSVNQTVYFDGSGSYDPDGDTLSYKWLFGDGTSTNWQYDCNSSHVYNKSREYTVTLFVTDGVGGWETVNDTCIIRVTKEEKFIPIIKEDFPTQIELDEDFGTWSITVTAYESHSNPAFVGDNLKWYITGNSNTIFHINGENSTGVNADTIVFHNTVNQYGTEIITYHLHDPIGFEAVIDQTVIVHPINDPPTANAGPDQNITVGQTVTLDGRSSFDIEEDILTYEWTSSIDGKLGNSAILKNIKLTAGIHIITLTVNDSERTGIDTCIIRVSDKSVNLPPVAKITPINQAFEGIKILLSAVDSFDEDGYITRYIWNFGDGTKIDLINQSTIEHKWASNGTYTITLTVIDDHGAESVDYHIIFIINPKGNDTDGDGLPDDWEILYGLDPFNRTDAMLDTDSDTLSNLQEFILKTNPTKYDTDDDGVLDYVDAFPTDVAASVDTDGDGYPDSWNPGMSEGDSTTGLELDAYPNNPKRYKKEISKDDGFQNNIIAIILIVIVIIILLILATFKIFLTRSKRQRLINRDSDDEMLSSMKHKILHDETLTELEYSQDEIEGLLDRKLKSGQITDHTYNLIRSEILGSEEAQLDQKIKPEFAGKE